VVATYLLALIGGGVFTASVLWAVSGFPRLLPPTWRAGILGLAVITAIFRDLHVLRIPLPQSERQVPRTVFHKGSIPAAGQFGFELGTGLRTYLPSTLPYVLGLGIWLLAPSLSYALAAGVGFGLGRGLMALWRYVARSCDAWDCLLESKWLVPVCSLLGGLAVPMLLIR